jgi:GNAT superfamily N-acetyltransferase
MSLSTRKATVADTLFARDAHRGYREAIIAQFGQWDEQIQDGFFDRDWGEGKAFDILLWNGEPCGYTTVEDRPDDIHVREVVVHPSYQGRGIGTVFLRSVMERAASRGVPVRLGTFHRNPAFRLYQRLGFREFGRTDIHVLLEWQPDCIGDRPGEGVGAV